MIYVDINSIQIPDGWFERASSASQAVANGADPKDYDAVWRELKDPLGKALNDKCWYCETPIPRSDNAVDHFRPKGRVSDALQPHNGYRWLAFEKENYRYACTYCNSKRKDSAHNTSGGKADRFPLVDETLRVYDAAGDITSEYPALLDPCNVLDGTYLGCKQENGKSCVATNDPTERMRASVSIEIYHLNHEPTCKLRHSTAMQMLAAISDGKRQFELMCNEPRFRVCFQATLKRIAGFIDKRSPYSGEMRFILAGHRCTDYPWIDAVLGVIG